MLAKKTSKNQLTLPKSVLKGLEDVEYFDVHASHGEIILRPVVISPKSDHLVKIRERIRLLGLTPKDIDDAVRWARK